MADPEYHRILKQSVKAFNEWRKKNPDITPNLSLADLSGANLRKADLSRADLSGANLRKADLSRANLSKANLSRADLTVADLIMAYLIEANLCEAILQEARLLKADLSRANLSKADLSWANLSWADLSDANLYETDISRATLIATKLNGTNLIHSRVYGISAWDLILDNTTQTGLIITKLGDPVVTVDDIEVAQFIYFMLTNKKIRRVIDTITSKAVLILGRFTKKRKAILDALREKLSTMDYLPIIFDFDKPTDRDLTETVKTLAGLSKFIIMDLSDPSSSPHEAAVTITNFKVPFLPILEAGQKEYAMFDDLRKKHPWVLQEVTYNDQKHLIENIEKLTKLAEKKYIEIQAEKNLKRLGPINLDDI
jgi:hypothetical protein